MGVEVDDQEKTWWVLPEGEAVQAVQAGGRGPEADGDDDADASQKAARGGVTRVASFATRVQAVPYSRSPNCRVDLSRRDRNEIEDQALTLTLAPAPAPSPNPNPVQARLRADRGPHDAAARGQAQARLPAGGRSAGRAARAGRRDRRQGARMAHRVRAVEASARQSTVPGIISLGPTGLRPKRGLAATQMGWTPACRFRRIVEKARRYPRVIPHDREGGYYSQRNPKPPSRAA